MSDISIPGVNSRFNTESLVQELVDAESIRLDRMRGQLDEYQTERRVWQELNTNLSSLRSNTRNLFSFENPFNERIAISSNEAVLRADAGRTAIEGITKIRVHQIAQADRFISQDLPIDMQVEKGIYRFVVGEQNVTLRFRGGSVQEFAAALNRRNPELIRSSVIRNRTDSQVILVESLKSGSSHVLAFEEDAAALATELGWTAPAVKIRIRSPDSAAASVPASAAASVPASVGEGAAEGSEGEIILPPGAKMVLPFSEAVENTANLALRYDLRLVSELLPPPPPLPPGPEAPDSGSVSLGNVTLPNFPSTFTPPPQPEQEPIKTVEDYALIFARNGTQRTALPDVPNSENFVTVRIPLSEYTAGLDSLEISNVNTHKTLTMRNIEIMIATPPGGNRTAPPGGINADGSRNALIEIEGIFVERESNTIDDVIPGVTLELRTSAPEEVEIRIEPDHDLIKDTLIEWVGRYNQIIRDINIFTRNNQEIIDEIEYFTDEERERYTTLLGIFQGDNILNTLRQRLQTITSSSYETSAGQDISLLSHIGISTNASRGASGSVNFGSLRGYLEINESLLDQSLSRNVPAIKDLFGRDSDDDLTVDQGVGYQLDQIIQSYTTTGGIIASRSARYDNLISSENEDIEDYEEFLKDYEADARRQFGAMESAINNLENSAQGLQNLNSRNNSNNNN